MPTCAPNWPNALSFSSRDATSWNGSEGTAGAAVAGTGAAGAGAATGPACDTPAARPMAATAMPAVTAAFLTIIDASFQERPDEVLV
nr:hypothetical protein [Rhodococcus sp. LB1]